MREVPDINLSLNLYAQLLREGLSSEISHSLYKIERKSYHSLKTLVGPYRSPRTHNNPGLSNLR